MSAKDIIGIALMFLSTLAFAGDFEDGVRHLDKKEYKRAMDAFRSASAHGNASAARNLGFMYYNGLGVPRDVAKAVEWFAKAAGEGDIESQVNLGIMYENGLSVAQDAARSAYWFRKAADQGHRRSQFRIGEILFVGQGMPQDYVEADKWWRIALREDGESSAWMRQIVEAAERKMTPEQMAEAQRRSEEWKPAVDAARLGR